MEKIDTWNYEGKCMKFQYLHKRDQWEGTCQKEPIVYIKVEESQPTMSFAPCFSITWSYTAEMLREIAEFMEILTKLLKKE